jgi:hypothetical protein
MAEQPEPTQGAVAAVRALSRAAVFAGGINPNLWSDAVDVNAGPLDRDELLKLVRLLTGRLAMMSKITGDFIEQIPNRLNDRETAMNQILTALEAADNDR